MSINLVLRLCLLNTLLVAASVESRGVSDEASSLQKRISGSEEVLSVERRMVAPKDPLSDKGLFTLFESENDIQDAHGVFTLFENEDTHRDRRLRSASHRDRRVRSASHRDRRVRSLYSIIKRKKLGPVKKEPKNNRRSLYSILKADRKKANNSSERAQPKPKPSVPKPKPSINSKPIPGPNAIVDRAKSNSSENTAGAAVASNSSEVKDSK